MENNKPEGKNLKDRVLESIEENKIHVHSRAHFVGRVVLLVLVALLALTVSVLIFSFILFSIRISGYDSLLGFGHRGLLSFLRFFPWPLLLLDIGLLIVLERMLRQFRFGYRKSVLYLFLVLLVASISIGFVVDRGTGINERMLRRADRHELPRPFGNFYQGARHKLPPGSGICRCTITAINGNILDAQDIDSEKPAPLKITLSEDDAILNSLKVGDRVFVFGEAGSGTIKAIGIKPFPGERFLPSTSR